MTWDPLASWPRHYRLFGALLALILLGFQGKSFLLLFWTEPLESKQGGDFFQDWVSGHSIWQGGEVYPSLSRWLHDRFGPEVRGFIEYNAHPPTAVLLVTPFCILDYQPAFLAWNLFQFVCFVLSLWLMGRELRLRWSPELLLMVAGLMMLCGPLRQQIAMGQFNGCLLFLLTAAWTAWRRGHPGWTGVWLALATAIKFYPGLFFVYFLVRRQWRLVFTGTAAFLAVSGLTLALLGWDGCRKYVQEVMPIMANYPAGWPNASLAGIWHKLFDAGRGYDADHVVLLWHSPLLCRLGTAASLLCILVMWWRAMPKAPMLLGSTAREDLAFSLTILTMSLISPITWDHYLLLLLLTLLIMSRELAWSDRRAWLLALATGLCCIMPGMLWNAVGLTLQAKALPWQTATALSVHLYALLLWFGLNWHMLRSIRD